MKIQITALSLFMGLTLYSFAQTAQTTGTQQSAVKKTTITIPKAKSTKAKKTKKVAAATKANLTPASSANPGHPVAPAAKSLVGGNTNSTGSGKPNVGGGNGGGTITPAPAPDLSTSIVPSDAVAAIKQALSNGILSGVSKVAVTDGYFGNSLIKIPFPQDAGLVETTLREIGLGSMVDNVTLSLNRAAENAAGQATPIFINSITHMTITDALGIVNSGQPDAATQFLKSTTTEQLVTAFKPAVTNALNTVSATKYWADVIGEYNKIPLVGQINTDLPDYVTRQAVNGLFIMIAKEEANIRKNPLEQTSTVLKKVFGSVKPK